MSFDGGDDISITNSSTDSSIVSSPEPPAEPDNLESRLAVERELLETDREKLLKDLAAKENRLRREKEEKESVVSKIKALESKLISGTGQQSISQLLGIQSCDIFRL